MSLTPISNDNDEPNAAHRKRPYPVLNQRHFEMPHIE